jgi:solute carrier family 25 (mitochondrial uncoupling protein), member 8/9
MEKNVALDEMRNKLKIKQDSFLVGFISGGVASIIAETLTLPLDTAKVRMQIYGMRGKYGSIRSTLKTIRKEQGSIALWNSLTPACVRQFMFSGIKLSLYEPIRNSFCTTREEMLQTPLPKKILAGVLSGGFACYMVSPIDLVQTRMQDSEFKKRYKGLGDCLKQIYLKRGARGFFGGIGLNLLRNSVMNAAELTTYDSARQYVLCHTHLSDAPQLYLFYGIAAGIVGSLVAQPIDILKTRVMNNPEIYKDGWTCFKMTLRNEGFLKFYSGISPFMVRATGFNSIFFLSYGYCRQFFSKKFDAE